jgi:WD40-like Beta Propeller Repeat
MVRGRTTARIQALRAITCGSVVSAGVSLALLAPAAAATTWTPFSNPAQVAIAGYPGSAEEPFISPDGRYLLFNSS